LAGLDAANLGEEFDWYQDMIVKREAANQTRRTVESVRARGAPNPAIHSGEASERPRGASINRQPTGQINKAARPPVIRNKYDILILSGVLITALEDLINERTNRNHNHPPPDAVIETSDDIELLRLTVSELQRLNGLLEQKRRVPRTEVAPALTGFQKHLDRFLTRFSSTLGAGMAGLLIATAASLLYKAGVAPEVVSDLLNHIKFQ
jgi:hypothetical protein